MKQQAPGPSPREQVEDWLKNSGYPFEMRVVDRFAKQQFGCNYQLQSSVDYFNSDVSDYRELDVLLDWHQRVDDVTLYPSLFIECKDVLDPWVILKRPTNSQDQRPLFAVSGAETTYCGSRERVVTAAAAIDAELRKRAPLRPAAGYNVASAKRKDSNRDPAYQAVKQVAGAARNIIGFEDHGQSDALSNDLGFGACVVLTTAPLFEAQLNSSSDEVEVFGVARSAVMCLPPGLNARGHNRRVDIVNYSAGFGSLLEDCTSVLDALDSLNEMGLSGLTREDVMWFSSSAEF